MKSDTIRKSSFYYLIVLTSLIPFFCYSQNIEFTIDTTVPFDDIVSGSTVFEDIDNDNDLDLILVGVALNSRIAKIYLNDGTGNFSELTQTSLNGVNLTHINVADIDNDNDADLIITGQNGDFNRVSELYLNDGFGNYSINNQAPFDGVDLGNIAFFDYDSDEDLDVLIIGQNNTTLSIAKLYENDGLGDFSIVNNTPFVGVRDGEIAIGDYDNDNDLDVIITGSNNQPNTAKLYLNNGNSTFSELTPSPFVGVGSGTVNSIDIDNDGDLDVFLTGLRTLPTHNVSKLYINDGAANFTELLNTPFERVRSGFVDIADINNDGYLDILITGVNDDEQPVSKLYKNLENNEFEEILNQTFEGVFLSSVSIADINNDNLLDILITGYNMMSQRSTKLYVNQSSLTVNESAQESVVIYPNPTSDRLFIRYPKYKSIEKISIINILGQNMFVENFNNTNSVELSIDFKTGVYFLLIEDEKGLIVTKRLIINN